MPLGNTSYLQIALMAESDSQKYLLHNDAIQAIDESLNRILVLDFLNTHLTLTESQLTRYGSFKGTGNLIPRTLTIPATVGTGPAIATNRFFIFHNDGGDTITLTHGGGGTTVAVPASTVTLVLCDGFDIISVASASGFNMGVREEGGGNIVNNPSFLNFVGNGVTASLNGLGADIGVVMPAVQDDATSVQTDTTYFNFTGAGVTAAANGNGVDINIPGATAGVNVEDAGVATVSSATVLNFLGNNITVTDVAGDAHVTLSAPAGQDEGVGIQSDPTFFNFIGAGVTATTNGTGIDVTIPGSASTGVDLEDTGTSILTGATVLDFHGNNVSVTDVGGDGRVEVTAPAVQDEGGAAQSDPTFINFVGAGVTAAASGNGVTVTIPGASGTAIPVDDDGVNIVSAADRLDFVGAGVTVIANGNTAEITVNAPSIETQSDSTQVVSATDTINFTGAGVTVTNPSGDVTEVNIPGGSGTASAGDSNATLIQTIDCGTDPQNAYDIASTDGWDEIVVVWHNIESTVGDTNLQARVSTDGGTTFDSTVGAYQFNFNDNGTPGTSDAWELGSASASDPQSGVVRFTNMGLPIPTSMYASVTQGTRFTFEGIYDTAVVTDAIRIFNDDGVNSITGGTIYVVGIRYAPDIYAPWKGARVNLTAAESIAAGVDTTLDWDTADREVGTWWSAANPSRLTVPAGVTRVRVASNLRTTTQTGQFFGEILMNGVVATGLPRADTDTDGSDNLNMVSDVIDVVAGDYFEVSSFSNNARDVSADTGTWFSIEAVEGNVYDATLSTPVAFHAHLTADALSSGVIEFDTEDLDEGGDYNTGNGAFVAPMAGVYHFYAGAVIVGGAGTGNLYLRVNTTRRARGHSFGSTGTQNDNHTVLFTVRLEPGDIVDVESSFTASGTTPSWTWFGGYLINAATGNQPLAIHDEPATALNSVEAHANGYVASDSASAVVYTVDDDTLFNHDIGTTISIEQVGLGQVTISAGSGVTLRAAASPSTRAQYSVVMLTKVAPDTWNLTGDLTP